MARILRTFKDEVEFEGDLKVLLRSRAGDRIVGAALHGKSGTLLFLPPLGLDGNQWIRDAERDEAEGGYWTNDALNLGKRIVVALVNLADALKASLQTTPAPSWADASNYRLDIESKLETNIANMSSEIHALQAKKSELETQLKVAGNLRHLLYEKGKPLEQAVLESMNLLGFSAERYTDGDSEFDLVLSSDEGRCIGEVEGKDNAAVNIDKFSQLERNLQEDFARDEISIHAKGVLFGNAFRLVPPQERKQYFTDKCISAAKRIGAALVQTPDLFSVAQYLKQNPSDVSYASMCRNAILETAGDVVQFPPPPVQTATSVTQVSGVEEGDAEVQIIPAGNKTD